MKYAIRKSIDQNGWVVVPASAPIGARGEYFPTREAARRFLRPLRMALRLAA